MAALTLGSLVICTDLANAQVTQGSQIGGNRYNREMAQVWRAPGRPSTPLLPPAPPVTTKLQ